MLVISFGVMHCKPTYLPSDACIPIPYENEIKRNICVEVKTSIWTSKQRSSCHA